MLFSVYLFAGFVSLTIAYLSGALFRILFTTAPATAKPYQFFISTVIGITIWVSSYSLWFTYGQTIHLAFVVLTLFSLYPYRHTFVQRLTTFSFRSLFYGSFAGGNALKYGALTFGVFLINIIAQYLITQQAGSPLNMSGDTLFYSRVSYYIQTTGIENINGCNGLFDNSFQTLNPYHYYELWLNAIGVTFFNLHEVLSIQLFCYPLLFTLAGTGMVLYALSRNLHPLLAFSLLLLIYIEPVNFLNNQELGGYTVVGISHNAKNLPAVLFLMLFLISLFEEKKIEILWLLAAAITSVAITPAIIGGVIAFLFLSFFAGRYNAKYARPLSDVLMTCAVVAVYVLLYFILGNKQTSPQSLFSMEMLITYYRTIINILGGSLIYLSYLFIFAILLILISAYTIRKTVFPPSVTSIQGVTLIAAMFVVADIMFAMFFTMPDGVQFFSIITVITTSLLLIFLWIELIPKVSYPVKISLIITFFLLGITGVMQSYSYQFNLIYAGTRNHDNDAFIEKVLERQTKMSPASAHNVGFSIQKVSRMNSVFDKNISVFCVGDFIAMAGKGHCVISLHGPDIPINNTVPYHGRYEKHMIGQGIFNQYYHKTKSDTTSLNTIRLKFIKEKKLLYGFFEDSTLIPAELKSYMQYTLKSKKTGMIYTELKIE